jgi:signal transduction histidine kinase
LRDLLGPRPFLMAVFAAVIVALLGTFAYVLTDARAQARQQSEQRFGSETSITAQLTTALFATSTAGAETSAAKSFGGRTINQALLEKAAKGTGVRYVVILDRHGKEIAASRASPISRFDHAAKLPHVRAALGGIATLSDLVPGSKAGHAYLLEWAMPFETSFGRRVAVEAIDPSLISRFVRGYLGKSLTGSSGNAFVVDGTSRIIVAVGNTTAKSGRFPTSADLFSGLAAKAAGTYRYAGAQRYFSSAPVGGASWRVVRTAQTSQLYSKLAGSSGWWLYAELIAFGLAGAVSLLMFRRALRTGQELSRVNGELVAVNVTLEERVAERTAAAEERATELARSNDELEQFSSVASHDLQEPLRKIRMFGERLRDRLGDTLAEEPAADLARMGNAAERMQRLINDLLDYSRVTHRGKEFERTDLGRITREVIADLEARVVELDATIDVGDLPVIDADPTQMRQLIQNLIGNALKFHREDVKPVVRIRSETIAGHPARFPGESPAAGRCVITIEDNGIGFEEKHAERVFTAFERLHGRSSYEGTGIGLSIARKIAWRHGGHITAVGESGTGATFTVTLPVSQ